MHGREYGPQSIEGRKGDPTPKEYDRFIPLDKSWIIRMGFLDIIHGYTDIDNFLDRQEDLSDDLHALARASKAWRTGEPIDVGESGTLYRFLRFASWKLGIDKEFIKRGSLVKRKITEDPHIVNLSIEELLKLNNGTTQWASAAVLLGNEERVEDPDEKLALSYEALDHWKKQRAEGKSWEPRDDKRLLTQAETFLALKNGEKVDFNPKSSEDYCFARMFGYISKEDGERRWPTLRTQESNRIEVMERVIAQVRVGEKVDSRDHRIVQAAAMWGKFQGVDVAFAHPEAVTKSWPMFWNLLIGTNRRKESSRFII